VLSENGILWIFLERRRLPMQNTLYRAKDIVQNANQYRLVMLRVLTALLIILGCNSLPATVVPVALTP